MKTCYAFLALLTLVLFACKKTPYNERDNNQNEVSQKTASSFSLSSNSTDPACRLTLQQEAVADSILVPTHLGTALVGDPYSVSVMQQAARSLYGTDLGIVANKKYIRYRPSSLDQMETLANSDLELFDYPLDYDVEEEGDYYAQPGIGENDLPWLYTVVEPSYQPISGITYEELAQLYVPDDDIFLEDEAFRITGNAIDMDDCSSQLNTTSASSGSTDVSPNSFDFECAPGYVWDPELKHCIPEEPRTPTPPPTSSQPAGKIRVWDNSIGQEKGVRRTRVVLRRYFKIDRVYTDDYGNFTSNKHFKNKVNVLVKFKSTQLTTRGLKGARFWQMLFPIKHAIGKYSGNLNNFVPYVFTSDRQGASVANRNWWAALLMNAYLEFNEQTAAISVGGTPNNMRILLTSWDASSGGGSTPMNYLRSNVDAPSQAYIQQFVVSPLSAWGAQAYNSLYNSTLRGFDMTLGYNTESQWNSDKVKYLMFHELGHAAHYNRVGQSWWNSFVYSEAYATYSNGVKSANSPYGTGTDGLISDYIALGESWAEHLGRTIADRVYGVNSTPFLGQRSVTYYNNLFIAGSSHINYLEDFSPFRTVDPFRWIPNGLWNDLIDNRNDAFAVPLRVDIDDAVFGFTNQQLFGSLDDDIINLRDYRVRLLNENGNRQAIEVTILFNRYGY